jgi:hypothetical protein
VRALVPETMGKRLMGWVGVVDCCEDQEPCRGFSIRFRVCTRRRLKFRKRRRDDGETCNVCKLDYPDSRGSDIVSLFGFQGIPSSRCLRSSGRKVRAHVDVLGIMAVEMRIAPAPDSALFL